MNLKMPGVDGMTALRELRDRGVPARVLVLTSVAERARVLPVVRAGAAGLRPRGSMKSVHRHVIHAA